MKAEIAHLWFVTIHPFDDGNGRMSWALTDMLLDIQDLINKGILMKEKDGGRSTHYTLVMPTPCK